uniref:SJCHGC03639 protein n=1 Tax=Schistosoma japonicum TaxID=6182 RepID=Q5D9H7_SCHJA|nr:SJCHGC03639 protein [Schistosoma japonicum]
MLFSNDRPTDPAGFEEFNNASNAGFSLLALVSPVTKCESEIGALEFEECNIEGKGKLCDAAAAAARATARLFGVDQRARSCGWTEFWRAAAATCNAANARGEFEVDRR